MSTSFENINSFKRNTCCISIAWKSVALGLLTACCSGSVGAGAQRPTRFRDSTAFPLWRSIQSADRSVCLDVSLVCSSTGQAGYLIVVTFE